METRNVVPNQFTKGMFVLYNGGIFIIVEFHHIKVAQRRATMSVRMKNIVTGQVLEPSLRSDEMIQQVIVDEKKVTYLYSDRGVFHFMDMETGKEVALTAAQVGDQKFYMKEGDTVSIAVSGGESITLKLPVSVELKIAETPPGVKGDTAAGGSKPAVLETGLTIKVPLFVKEGERVKVDTRTGEYLERAK
jgi:elongation factor P